MTKPLEAHIEELQELIDGPHGKLWYHTPAVSALIAALEQSQEMAVHLREQRDEEERKAISNFEECASLSARLAELEASQLAVKLPQRYRSAFMRYGKGIDGAVMETNDRGAWVNHDDVVAVLRAAGITVQGDE